MDTATSLVIVLLTILAGFVIGKFIIDSDNKRKAEAEEEMKELLKIEEEERIKKEERLKQLEEKSNNYMSELVTKYGTCDKTVVICPDNPFSFNNILVFSTTKHVVVAQKEFSFSDILDCTFNDELNETEIVHTYRENSTATTTTNTGSMIGRAIVGGVLLGGAGAIIGGSTAKKDTIIEHGPDTSIHNKEIKHNYFVAITVKDIVNPMIYINVGNNATLKDEIVSLMKVIMSMK